LPGLSGDGSAGNAAREFALDGGEDAFRSRSVFHRGYVRVRSHFSAYGGAATGEAFGGHDAMNVQSLAAEGVVVLGVESGIGQDAADWGVSMGSGLPERAAWHSRSRVPAGSIFRAI